MKTFFDLYDNSDVMEFHKTLQNNNGYMNWEYVVNVDWMKFVIKHFLESIDIKYEEGDNYFYNDDYKIKIYFLPYIDIPQNKFEYSDKIVDKNYSFNLFKKAKSDNIRCVQLHENYFVNEIKFNVFLNVLNHIFKKNTNRIYARDCKVEVYPAITMKPLFEKNNIQGYRNARTAFVLVDKKTSKEIMCYTIGHAHFGKGMYDAEVARGACLLGYSVVGGASKLWEYIKKYYATRTLQDDEVEEGKGVNSIVYYIDLNLYDGRSISNMGNNDYIEVGYQAGFRNLWTETKILKEREPKRHALIMQLMREGKIAAIPNAGTMVNVWVREGTESSERINNLINSKKIKIK